MLRLTAIVAELKCSGRKNEGVCHKRQGDRGYRIENSGKRNGSEKDGKRIVAVYTAGGYIPDKSLPGCLRYVVNAGIGFYFCMQM